MYADFASMSFYDRLANRQTQTSSALFAIFAGIGLFEALEDHRLHIGWNAAPVVGNVYLNRIGSADQ